MKLYNKTMIKRNCAIDFMKFLAVLMVTNSHFQPLYKDINVGLATFGAHGNALFFFVSGFLLMAGFKKNIISFANWYKKRLCRLWPAAFLWVSVAGLIFGRTITFSKIFFFSDYWFLQSLVVYYVLYFVLCSQQRFKRFGGYKFIYIISVLIAVVTAFILPKCEGSIFHSNWHYIYNFSAMILGGICYNKSKELIYKQIDWVYCITSFVIYFIIQKFGKGHTNCLYYMQLLAIIPLHAFVWYCYKVCSRDWNRVLFKMKLGRVVQVISALTLEIYIVQFQIITDKWNDLSPLNVVIVFTTICLTAYLLRIVVNLFLQFMSKDEWDIKQICYVI